MKGIIVNMPKEMKTNLTLPRFLAEKFNCYIGKQYYHSVIFGGWMEAKQMFSMIDKIVMVYPNKKPRSFNENKP